MGLVVLRVLDTWGIGLLRVRVETTLIYSGRAAASCGNGVSDLAGI